MKKPPLINPLNNEDDVEAGHIWKQSADFGRLIELMFHAGAFGVTKKGDIWQTIYTNLKYEPDVPTPEGDQADKKNSRQKWEYLGETRMANLRKKRYPLRVTYAEADHFRYFFGIFAGKDWFHEFEPDQIVTWPLSKIIDHGKSKGFSWPENTPAYYQFRSVLDAHSGNSELDISYEPEKTKSIFDPASKENPDVRETYTRYEAGTSVSIVLDNVETTHNQVLIFYVADQELETVTDSNRGFFDISLVRLTHADSKKTILNSPSGGPYRVGKAKGGFCLYAVALRTDLDLQKETGMTFKENAALSQQQSETLLSYFKKELSKDPTSLHIADHIYEV